MREYPLYPVTHYESFGALIAGIEKNYGENPAITVYSNKGEKTAYSYTQLASDVRMVCRAITARGWTGKHIALVGENSYEWAVVFLAAACCGNTAVLIDIEQPTEMIGHDIDFGDAEIIFVSQSMAGVIKEIPSLAALQAVSLEEQGLRAWAAFGQEAPQAYGEADEGKLLVYTSGTTDAPKAVELSLSGVLFNAAESIAMVKTTRKVYTCLPLYHAYGLTCGLLANLIAGAEIGLNGNLKTMMRDLTLFQPGTVMAVPLIAELLYKTLAQAAGEVFLEEAAHAAAKWSVFKRKEMGKMALKAQAIKEKTLGNVSLMVCGGAHLSAELIEKLGVFGIQVLQGYGITECSPLVSVNRNQAMRADSVGQLLPGCRAKISKEGELLVAGKSVMRGYYKEEKLTKEAFAGEWFKTGDLARIDKQGYLYLNGRLKNLIVLKNGKKILPEEIEGKLKEIPLVQDAVVYGAEIGFAEDDVKVAATVYADPQKTAGMAAYEILSAVQREIDEMNKRLPMYQQIQLVNISEEEPDRTALKKIKRPGGREGGK